MNLLVVVNPTCSQRGESQRRQTALIRPVSSSCSSICNRQTSRNTLPRSSIRLQSLSGARRASVQESSESKKRLNRRLDQGRQPNSRHSLAPPENFGSKVASVPLPSNNYQYHYQTSARQRQKQEAEADLIRADRALPLLHRKDSYHPLLARSPQSPRYQPTSRPALFLILPYPPCRPLTLP
jgi:hypothetical protein